MAYSYEINEFKNKTITPNETYYHNESRCYNVLKSSRNEKWCPYAQERGSCFFQAGDGKGFSLNANVNQFFFCKKRLSKRRW